MELNSKKVAQIAGVSVRTLRHYHALGILPEPERTWSGYRCYTAEDVVRLLRIRRLAELGLKLSTIGEIMADPSGQFAANTLRELDRQLREEAAAIRARRKVIAQFLATGPELDVPQELAQQLARSRDIGWTGPDEQLIKDLLEVKAAVASKQELTEFSTLMNTDSLDNYAPQFVELDNRLSAVDHNSSPQCIADLVEDYSSAVISFFRETATGDTPPNTSPAALAQAMYSDLLKTHMSEKQAEIVDKIVQRVRASLADGN